MPTTNTFEQAVALLADKPNPMSLGPQVEVFYQGLLDASQRLQNLEHEFLKLKFQNDSLTDELSKTNIKLGEIEAQHTQYKNRVVAVEQAPHANDKRIDDLDKRVRTVEGAVGSASYKAPTAIKPNAAPSNVGTPKPLGSFTPIPAKSTGFAPASPPQ